MNTRDMNALYKELLGLGEKVIVTVHRANPEGGWHPGVSCEGNDLVVTAGRTFLANRIGAAIGSAMAHMAVGSGSTAAGLSDTALLAERARKALAVNSAISANVYTAVATFGGAADSVTSVQIAEAGIFNHASSGQGTMFQRITFSAITLADSDLLQLTLQTNVGSS